MEKKGRRMVMTAAACALTGAAALGGTMAYLTDNEVHVNTFTVGKVQIDLQEPGWDPGDGEELVPNERVDKDPKIENTGVNRAYVFAEVKIPAKEVITATPDGTKQGPVLQDLFTYGTVEEKDGKEVYTAGGIHDGWTLLLSEKASLDGACSTYVFGYGRPLEKGEETPAVFDQVKFLNLVEGQLDGESLSVPVKGYAIQAEINGDGQTAIDGVAIQNPDLLTEEEMKAVYRVFAGQNDGFQDLTDAGSGLKEADTGGEKDLAGNPIA